jgi:hypothetical protein
MSPPAPLTRRRAIVVCASVALIVAMCAGLVTAAALVPAPPAVVPLLAMVCIGCPMVAACELPAAIAALRRTGRARRLDSGAVARLHRQLDSLPETQHPLGL